jgi:hypothetical protein
MRWRWPCQLLQAGEIHKKWLAGIAGSQEFDVEVRMATSVDQTQWLSNGAGWCRARSAGAKTVSALILWGRVLIALIQILLIKF